ncbi:MAG: hypothetical protein NC548_05780 [Lachnospiraceae bacterium]|nr:hypothetical protein [Lachnospiraceae bacterium]
MSEMNNTPEMEQENTTAAMADNEPETAFATGMTTVPESEPEANEPAHEIFHDVEGGTKKIDPDAEENVLYKKYGLDELENYIEGVGDLSYLELISLRNQMYQNIERIQSCKAAMDQLKTVANQLNSAAAMANCLDHYGIDLTSDEFYEMYDLYLPKLRQIMDLCKMHIDGIGERANSTKYMNANMILVLEKRLFSLDNTNPENASKIKELLTTIDVYKNRTDFYWIERKLSNMIQNKKQLRMMANTLERGSISDMFGELAKNFAAVNLGGFVTYLQDRLEYEDGDILALLYCLNRILDVKASGGEETWIKVFVLNISDIMGNIYDLRVTADELQACLDGMLSKLLPQASQYLFGTRKIKVNPSIMDFYHRFREKYIEAVNAENARLKKMEDDAVEEAKVMAEAEATTAAIDEAVARGNTHPYMYDANGGEPDDEKVESEKETAEAPAETGNEAVPKSSTIKTPSKVEGSSDS